MQQLEPAVGGRVDGGDRRGAVGGRRGGVDQQQLRCRGARVEGGGERGEVREGLRLLAAREQRPGAGTEYRPGPRPGGGGPVRLGRWRPGELEQRVLLPGGAGVADRAQLLGRDRAGDQGLDGDHRGPGAVGGVQHQLLRTRDPQPHPQRGGAGGVQPHPPVGERQPLPGLRGVLERGEVQRGVQQRGVHAVAAGGLPLLLGEGDVGEVLVAEPPGRAQPEEGGPVLKSGLGQGGSDVVELDLGGPGRRPAAAEGGCGRLRGRTGLGENAVGVPGPVAGVALGSRLGPRVDGDRAPSGAVRGAHGDLELHRVALVEDQRRLDDQFVEHVGAELVPGADRQLHEGRSRDEDRAEDRVVGEPRMRPQRQAAGEQRAARVGEAHCRADQRMGRRGQPQALGVRVGGLRLVQPEAAALEGVGGQVQPARGRAAEEGGPVDPPAVDGDMGQGGDHRLGLRAVPAQGGDQQRALAFGALAQGLADHGGEHAVRPELHEGGHPGGLQLAHHVPEPHGLADVPDPVVGAAQLLRRGEDTGQVRHHRDLRRGVRQPGGHLAELAQHALHVHRVEGVADPQPAGAVALVGEVPGQVEDGCLVAGEHHGGGAVDGGDADPGGQRPPVRQLGQYLGLGGLDGDHRAAVRQRLHQPGAGGDQRRRVLEREHARDMSGRQFADGVAGDEVGPYAPGFEEAEQGHLDGEQPALGEDGPVQPAALRLGEHHLAYGEVDMAGEVSVQLVGHGVEGRREHRVRGVQLTSHTDPLAALAAEEEGQAAAGGRRRGAYQLRCGLAPGHRAEGVEQPGPVPGHDRDPLLQQRPGTGQCVGDVSGRRLSAVCPDEGDQPLGLGPERGRGPRGDQPGQHLRRRGRLGGLLLDRGGLLQDHMRVGAARAEGRYPDPARGAGLRPLLSLRQNPYAAVGPVDVR